MTTRLQKNVKQYFKDNIGIIDRTFTPEISEEKRTEMVTGWNKAVKCSYGWAKED